MHPRTPAFLALAFLLLSSALASAATGAEIASATVDKTSYAPGDVATISVQVVANNASLEKVNAFARCDTSSSCPLGGQVVEGVVAQPAIPPQVILRGPSNLTLGASGNYTGQVQIVPSPAGPYRIDITVTATSQGQPVSLAYSLTIQVVAGTATSTGNSGSALLAVVVALAVVALALLAFRSWRGRRAAAAEEDLADWPSLPKQG